MQHAPLQGANFSSPSTHTDMPSHNEDCEKYAAFDHLIEGAQIISPDLRYLYVNDAVCAQAHKSANELLGKAMLGVFPGLAEAPVFGAIKECLKHGQRQELRNPFIRDNGETGYFDLRIQRLPEGALVMSFDVTKQVEAENILRHTNSQLEFLVEQRTRELAVWERSAREALFVMKNGVVVDVNQGAMRLFEATKEQLVGTSPIDLAIPEDRHRASHRFACGDGSEVEFRCRTLSGRVIHVLAVAQQAEIGDDTLRVTSLRDISELRETQHDSQALVNALPSLVAYWDSGLRLRMANAAHEEWFGEPASHLTKDQLERSSWVEAKPMVEKALAGEAVTFDRWLPHPRTGIAHAFHVSYMPDIVDGAVRGFVVHSVDISERKRFEAQLSAALD